MSKFQPITLKTKNNKHAIFLHNSDFWSFSNSSGYKLQQDFYTTNLETFFLDALCLNDLRSDLCAVET